jgi:hypothetical protein
MADQNVLSWNPIGLFWEQINELLSAGLYSVFRFIVAAVFTSRRRTRSVLGLENFVTLVVLVTS